MAYKRFEEIPVWNDAVQLAKEVFDLSSVGVFRVMAGLKDQIERAAVSVSNNIAEGFERGTNGELVTFLYIAKGSAGEVGSMFCVMERLDPQLVSGRLLTEPKRLAESISRQLCGWIESIKDSGFEGNRSQTERTRKGGRESRRADDFMAYLREVQSRAPKPYVPSTNGSGPRSTDPST